MINQILFIIVVIVSNVIQVLTGFAGTMLAMPASMQLIGINEARAVLNAVALVLFIIVAVQNYKYVNKKEVVKITALMLLGMGVGIYLLQIMPTGILLDIYAILIICIALKKMFIQKEMPLPNFIMILVIFLAGIIHGIFNSGGSLLVIYAVTVLKDKNDFRATLAVIWVILNSSLLITHAQQGLFTSQVCILTVISILTAILSIKIGNKLHNKINQQVFLKITYVLLLISGLMLIF
ncbi:hypothetical protein AN639_06970 [Candidatus Epulonipiscium fishelsonii]|uniref:Uncharacterized protein n=1 Tax=Candidatus Epulonipiscium fishelsonii TaxID=77094 RepID=A0ACC8XGK7_9FIRM|nr:hypothetical protein AN639_06970 [Epulopiscium sp. SCG-B05WGA-EpuloA1]ONI42761.1 hypothetical protein AN396_13255 [Epulopiscium sp. SCG-B11WGA-EpuloA1]